MVMPMTKMIKLHKKYLAIAFSLLTLTLILNLLAWISDDFADWHKKYIFPFWQSFMAVFSNLFPFSLGELLLGLAVLLSALSFICIFLKIIFKLLKVRERFCGAFLRVTVMIALVVSFVMTESCFILYHSSGLEEEYLSDISFRKYGFEELAATRDFIVTQANQLAKEIDRDEDGNPVYNGNLNEEAIESMQALSTEWTEFSGVYSFPKKLLLSEFMCQQSMRGYYFPFTMEANYNAIMTTVNFPSTVCHELAHTKGFMKEDEANFIAYIACINSDDKFFQYSGYLSVLNYINNDFKEACGDNTELYKSHVSISSLVKSDNVFMTEETEEKVESNAVISTAAVKKTTQNFIDTNLVINGIPEGAVSYSNVVGQLLYWYDDSSQTVASSGN